MNKLDFLWDTREKRNCLWCIFMDIFFVFISAIHLYLGFVLLQAHNYNQIFDLLSQPIVSLAILGRIVVNGMSMATVDPLAFLGQILASMNIFEMIGFILSAVILIAAPATRYEKRNRRITLLNVLAYALIIVLLLIIVVFSFQAGSLMDVLGYLHILGYVLMGLNLLLLIFNGYALCQMIVVDYPDALQVHVEVIDEI